MIKIYLGAPIEHASERKFLATIFSHLKNQGIPAVIFANFELGGRQIDCVIATATSAYVVEVKTSQFPVRGDLNGEWKKLTASGRWIGYTNAFQQAVEAKNRLRDAMKSVKPIGNFYPEGYVVFTSPIPDGSEITPGNFKALVTTLDRFLGDINDSGKSVWALSEWEVLARKLSLETVEAKQAISTEEEQSEYKVIKQYTDAVAAEFGREGNRWEPETEAQRNQLVTATMSDAGCYIYGPTGCGKSLMVKWLVAKLATDNNPTFLIAAKNFAGSWAEILKKEVGILTDCNAKFLYRAVARSGRPVFLIIDGINEFEIASEEALRGARAVARRMGARLIVTGQAERPAELNGLRTMQIDRPSLDLKRRIAQSNGKKFEHVSINILEAVESGIEAELVGAVGSNLQDNTTRLLLIDQYIRLRLGGRGRAGSFALRKLATELHERVAFSMSETEFDELMRTEGVSFADCDALLSTGLLVRRAGRVSFYHEMFQNSCAAFGIAKLGSDDPEQLGCSLSTPMLAPIAEYIIAAIDETDTCHAVLSKVRASSLLVSAVKGDLGIIAVSPARNILQKTMEDCVIEIRAAQLHLSYKNGTRQIGWGNKFRREWTAAEEARLPFIDLKPLFPFAGFRCAQHQGPLCGPSRP